MGQDVVVWYFSYAMVEWDGMRWDMGWDMGWDGNVYQVSVTQR